MYSGNLLHEGRAPPALLQSVSRTGITAGIYLQAGVAISNDGYGQGVREVCGHVLVRVCFLDVAHSTDVLHQACLFC
jgi:hypothetical protein